MWDEFWRGGLAGSRRDSGIRVGEREDAAAAAWDRHLQLQKVLSSAGRHARWRKCVQTRCMRWSDDGRF